MHDTREDRLVRLIDIGYRALLVALACLWIMFPPHQPDHAAVRLTAATVAGQPAPTP